MSRPMYGSNEPKTVSLRALQGEKYTLIQNDRDIASTLDYIGLPHEFYQDITGAVIWAHDGEYAEVWLTESGAWYDLSSQYHNLAYYLA